MSLGEYSRKRSFSKTPEPAPAVSDSGPGTGNSFCVQRHHATRLHYDLRLEAGGVLKSWAVPKGPTLDPAPKHVAIHVEDHPLEYGGFEGNIPKGNYGAGSVMLYDRGWYELLGEASAEEQLARGDLKFRLHGQKLNGEFALVRMKGSKNKGNEWLLLKKKDTFAQPGWDPDQHAVSVLTGRTQEEIAKGLPAAEPKAAVKRDLSKLRGARKADPPGWIEPMKAVIGTPPPKETGWIFEVKWDGVRALCFVEEGRVRMLSRNGNPIDRRYPELSILPHHVQARQAVLDGEIAALDERGLPSFGMLQRRMHVDDPASIAALSRSTPVVLYVFDLIYLDGWNLCDVPLRERKRLLRELLNPGDLIRLSDDFADGGALYEAAKSQGLEGIVAKNPESCYVSKRTSDWIKYKVTSQQEFVLCGYTLGERELFSALVVGLYEKDRLKWAGNVGTGFDRAMLRLIFDRMQPLKSNVRTVDPEPDLPKGIIWLKPELVCEVKFSSWTHDNRLRAPVFLGLRDDIDPRDCVREGGVDTPVSSRAELLPAGKDEVSLTIDGHKLKFTNLNKVYWPDEGYTKRDLLNYYDAVAPLLVPHLKDRPLSLKRYPNGIRQDYFFQKEVAPSFPKWLRTELADDINYVIGEDRATLLFLANLGCIDHNPYMSRVGSLENPDFLLIDLDPQECEYAKIVEAACLLRRKLESLGLEGYPKTTGGDGMHIYVPLEPLYNYDQVRSFGELLSHIVTGERPELFTTPRAVAKRQKGRVYFDWMQVGQGKTISAPYSVRPYEGATVATPLAWREVNPRLTPQQFTMKNVLDRFDRVGDLFEAVLSKPQRLETALEKLPGLLG